MKKQKLSKEQAYELCTEMWNLIAENDYKDKSQVLCDDYTQTGFPDAECFACEVNKTTCVKCPFWQYSETEGGHTWHGCMVNTSPYVKWQETRLSDPNLGKQYAIEIAQLFIDTLNYRE